MAVCGSGARSHLPATSLGVPRVAVVGRQRLVHCHTAACYPMRGPHGVKDNPSRAFEPLLIALSLSSRTHRADRI